MAESPPSARVADRYRLLSLIGSGGVGSVWRAHDDVLQRTVAIKEVRFPAELSPEDRQGLRTRVFREARAAGRLTHHNVVTVYDVFEDDGRAHIVMELVDAPTLATIVGEEGPLDHSRAAGIGLGILSALRAAHQAGIVHRDVKPANVMVDAAGQVKLGDFGIASVQDDPSITRTGLVIGSPAYMAPEQIRGDPTSPATDLWGLGATLHYAVEGRAPFERTGTLPTLAAVLHDEPAAPAHRGPLTGLIRELLTKEPADRPVAGTLRRRLEAVASRTEPDNAVRAPAVVAPAAAGQAPRLPLAEGTGQEEQTSLGAQTGTPTWNLPAGAHPGAPSTGWEDEAPRRLSPRRHRSVLRAASLFAVVLFAVAAAALWVLPNPDGDPSPGVVAPTSGAADATSQAALAPTSTERTASEATPGEATPGEATPGEPTPREPPPTETSDDATSPAAGEPATQAPPQAPNEPRQPAPTVNPPDDDQAEAQRAGDSGAGAEPPIDAPPGWVAYTDPTTGYRIAYPDGWEVVPRTETITDFRDPATGTYLRIDWTRDPPEDPVVDWQRQSESFAERHQGYEELRIEPVAYRDYDSALWEYRYRAGGRVLHAYNLGFDTGAYGHALNFQTRQENWEESQGLFETFMQVFEPAG